MIDHLLSFATVVVVFYSLYAVSTLAMQYFSLSDRAGQTRRGEHRLLDAMNKDPREVLLAAEMYKALAFLIIVIIVMHSAPKVSADLGWPWPPLTVAALVVVWLLRGLAGEVLPKTRPRDDEDDETLPRLATLALIWWLFRPLVILMRWLEKRRPHTPYVPEREDIVEHAIDSLAESAGMDEPVIEADERKMIQGVIGLEDTEVREIMAPRVDIVAIHADATLEDVRALTVKSGHSRFPVYEEDIDEIVGVLYVKDLFAAMESGKPIDLASLARRAMVIPETKKVDALLEEFRRQKRHMAIVVDEFGGTAGLVTLEDILEEIVGEIEDEHDLNGSAMEWITEDVMRASGVVHIEEVTDAFGIDAPDGEFETIGGLAYDRLGGVPSPGQTFTEHGLEFTIEKVEGQRIRLIRVERADRVNGGD